MSLLGGEYFAVESKTFLVGESDNDGYLFQVKQRIKHERVKVKQNKGM